MKLISLFIVGFMPLVNFCEACETLMHSHGTYTFTAGEHPVIVELSEITKETLSAKITFHDDEKESSGEVSIPVSSGEWAVQFCPPYEL